MNEKQKPSNQPYVLVVDDLEANLALIKNILNPLGANLILAKSATEALRELANHEVALALIDIHMPEISGFELAELMQQDPTHNLIPVIFITARQFSESEIEKFYSTGVVDYITKPFRYGIILRKVKVFLELHRQKQQIIEQKGEIELAVQKLNESNRTLYIRLTYENLLSRISEMAVPNKNLSNFFDECLEIIGQTIGASRTYIIEYCSKTETLCNTYEWCADAIIPQKEHLQNLPVSEIPWWHETLINGKLINFHDVEDIPEESTREILKAQDISSILVVPLFTGNKYFGHVGFDFCYRRHEWQEMDVELLISMSRILCSVIDRNITEGEKLKRMETEHALLNASLDSVFLIDADGIIIANNDVMRKRLNLISQDIIGKCIWDLLPADICMNRKEMVNEVFRTGLPLRFEDTRGDFTFENSVYPVTNVLGKVYRVAVYGHDITERKRAEEALRTSSELLEATQRLAKVGGWAWDVGSGKMLWTEETYRIHGLIPDEVPAGSPEHIQRSLACYDPEERLNIEAAFMRCVENGEPYDIETPFTTAQGRRGWVRTMARTEMEGTRVVRVLGNIIDITEKRKAEEALRVSEKMYRTLLSASPQGIVILDMKRIITNISDITVEIFGAGSVNDFIGKDFFSMIPAKTIEILKTVLSKTISDGLVQNEEVILEKKNKVPFVSDMSATLIQEDDGTPKAYMMIIRDISQKKIIEQQLFRSERLASLGEMAAAMAHEINQPLLSIQFGIENLVNKFRDINIADKKYLEKKSGKIFEDIVRISHLIDHVRAFSRDEEYINASFSVNESISNALSMISQQFKHHGIKLTVNLSKECAFINGNTYRFEQVMLNLLSNAKDAIEEKAGTKKSGFDKHVIIRSYVSNNSIYVEVKDNGCGIDENEIERILLPFYTTKETGKGTGLGLTISFSIIKELNGNIEIESKNKFGSTFRIILPVNQ